MSKNRYSVFSGSGCYIPENIIKNEYFNNHTFYESNGKKLEKSTAEIIDKLFQITGIKERRYVDDNLLTSDIGYLAAQEALSSADIDKETLDYIIVGHNFGEVKQENKKVDIIPSIAARIKNKLGIKNPYTVAYDITFGCPGCLQGAIQADYFIKSGDAKRALVIGAETLSRIADPHDRDAMIYSDGAGAVIVEPVESENPVGVVNKITRSDSQNQAYFLYMGKSYNPDYKDDTLFVKMEGRKLYQYAITTIPDLIKKCIDDSGITINDIKKILIHQANEKMDIAMLERLFKLYNINEIPKNIM